ncbi:hypothetical protein ACPA54_25045 [Uniformispora flossi]|uniref:hypothetical protein n=1 Tax=Uniformispora flossi TaxID=3390723 RepID=UPI003C2F6529
MTINFKLAVAGPAVAPSAMSVRSAELGSLLPASVLKLDGFAVRNLPSAVYAETDARVITDAARLAGRGESIGLAHSVEQAWRGSERTTVLTRDARPLASNVAACEQQQVTDMAHAMGSTGFAGMHGYPSWRTRT